MDDRLRPALVALGRAIQKMREERDIDAGRLAAAAGVGRERLEALESGRLDPDFNLLLQVAEAMGVRPSAFFRRAERMGGERGPGAP